MFDEPKVGHAILLQGDNNIPVLADTILVNLCKTVEGLHKGHHCWIYPCNGFESFSVLTLEITPMPDWFMMKYSVSEAYFQTLKRRIKALG